MWAHGKHLLRKRYLVHQPLVRRVSTNNTFFQVSDEVRSAISAGRPVVALESTIYTHGYPFPDNVALAEELESIARKNGCVPATIGIVDGVAKVGLTPAEIKILASSAGNPRTLKLSRRDLSYACGMRLANKSFHGGTTIAATMILAHMAGVKVFATGGLGGVHRGAESSMDISADLTELGRTPVAVVSSGCKSFLDIPRTLEYLETEGTTIATFADGREGVVEFPAFWSRDSGVRSPLTIESEKEAAAIIYSQSCLGIKSGLLFANPIPERNAIPKPTMDEIIEKAIKEADAAHASGKDNTPFILARIRELSGGASVAANRALIVSNVKRGSAVARELSLLEQDHRESSASVSRPSVAMPGPISSVKPTSTSSPEDRIPPTSTPPQPRDILVAGALAVDYSCDYASLGGSGATESTNPHLYTSNPARISQSLGGVAHNIAYAAHLLGSSVRLCSAVGDDLPGRVAAEQLKREQVDCALVVRSDARTAQYVAVNDAKKDLYVAMADMAILEAGAESYEDASTEYAGKWQTKLEEAKPKWIVLDGNWPAPMLHQWLAAGSASGAKIAFEPVSVQKGARLIAALTKRSTKPSSPGASNTLLRFGSNPSLHLMTPNAAELHALYSAATSAGLFDDMDWFTVLDSFNLPSAGSQARLSRALGRDGDGLIAEGIPQMSIQLLPLCETILTTLGPRGALLTTTVPKGDARLYDESFSRYIVGRAQRGGGAEVGGVYMRLFPPSEILGVEDLVSVNAAGDTFTGAVIAALAGGKPIEDAIDLGSRAAVLTLKHTGGVGDLNRLL